MRLARSVVPLAVTALALSFGWLWFQSSGKAAPHRAAEPDSYALDLVTQSGRYWDDAAVLGDSEHRLVTACMRKRGHTFPWGVAARAPVEKRPPGEATAVDLPYRRKHGYGIVASAGSSGPTKQDKRPFPPGYDNALTGNASIQFRTSGGVTITAASGGCRGEARAALAGSVERWATANYAADYMNDDLTPAIGNDPAKAGLLAEWRRCMSTAGYTFNDYGQPRELVQSQLDKHGATQELADRERRIATADGECVVGGRVIETELALRRRAAEEMPAAWKAELVRVAEIRRSAADQARAVLLDGDT